MPRVSNSFGGIVAGQRWPLWKPWCRRRSYRVAVLAHALENPASCGSACLHELADLRVTFGIEISLPPIGDVQCWVGRRCIPRAATAVPRRRITELDWYRDSAWRRSKPQERREPIYEQRGSIFDVRGRDRRLRIVLSTEAEDQAPDSPGELALGLLENDQIEVFRYADDGPPPDAQRIDAPWDPQAVEGWLTVRLAPDLSRGSMGTCSFPAAAGIHSSDLGGVSEVNWAIGHDSRDGAPPPDYMATALGRGAVALRSALGASADILITERIVLHPPPRFLDRTTIEVLRPADALPLLGLYLRSRGHFLVDVRKGRGTYTIQPPLYWQQAAFALTPSLEHHLLLAMTNPDVTLPQARGLRGIVARLALALQARDQVLRACLVPPQSELANAAAPGLDYVLLSLGAALDSLGKLVHHTLGMPGDDTRVSWTDRRRGRDGKSASWLRDLPHVAGGRAIRDLADDGGAVHFLRILVQLRNSIHGGAPEAVPAADDPHTHKPDRTLVRVTVRSANRLLESRDHLGGEEHWRIWPLHPSDGRTVVVDPAAVCDSLIGQTTIFIDRVVDALPEPGLEPAREVLNERIAERMRWLLGLTHAKHG